MQRDRQNKLTAVKQLPMESNDYQRLIEKLARIEALFADRAATVGEKMEAANGFQ
jgi:hypothetical protein